MQTPALGHYHAVFNSSAGSSISSPRSAKVGPHNSRDYYGLNNQPKNSDPFIWALTVRFQVLALTMTTFTSSSTSLSTSPAPHIQTVYASISHCFKFDYSCLKYNLDLINLHLWGFLLWEFHLLYTFERINTIEARTLTYVQIPLGFIFTLLTLCFVTTAHC